jgi:hypothetical protein
MLLTLDPTEARVIVGIQSSPRLGHNDENDISYDAEIISKQTVAP